MNHDSRTYSATVQQYIVCVFLAHDEVWIWICGWCFAAAFWEVGGWGMCGRSTRFDGESRLLMDKSGLEREY